MVKRWCIDYGVCLLIVFAIFYLSTADISADKEFSVSIPHADKIVHFTMYFVLTASICTAYVKHRQGCSWRQFFRRLLFHRGEWVQMKIPAGFWWIACLIPILYGGLMEILQGAYFWPRTADWFDFSANTLGALSSVLIFKYFIVKILNKPL